MEGPSVGGGDAGKTGARAAYPPKLPPAADEEFRSAPANLTALSRQVLAWLESPRDWESWPALPFQFASASASPRQTRIFSLAKTICPLLDFSFSKGSPSFSLLVLALRPRLHRRIFCQAILSLSVSASEILRPHHPQPASSSLSVLALRLALGSLSSSISICALPASVSPLALEARMASAKPRRAFLPAPFSFFRRSTARGRRSQARRRRQKSSREKGEAESRAR